MRLILSILLALCLCGQVFADETWYVDTSTDGTGDDGTAGAPYDTLAQFVAGKGGSLTGRGTVICYVDGATNDTTAVDLASFTNASATDHLEIISSDPFTGVFDDSKYYLVSSAGYTYSMANMPAYTVLRGLQLRMSNGNSSTVGLRANCTLDRCLIVSSGLYGVRLLAGPCTVNNCLIEASGSHGIYASSGYALTCMGTTITGSGGYGVYANGFTTWTFRNCVSAGNTSADWYKQNATLALNNCYSEDGTESTSTIAYSTATFANISAGTAADRRLVEGSGLIGAGADLTAYSTTGAPTTVDIDGDERPQNTTWDVGYDEYETVTAIYATNPSPADDATGQNRTVKLSWTDDEDAVSHDLWGGTNPASLSQLQDGSTQEWYVVSGLSPGVYYWRVDEIDAGSNTTEGEVWSFTVTGKIGARNE